MEALEETCFHFSQTRCCWHTKKRNRLINEIIDEPFHAILWTFVILPLSKVWMWSKDKLCSSLEYIVNENRPADRSRRTCVSANVLFLSFFFSRFSHALVIFDAHETCVLVYLPFSNLHSNVKKTDEATDKEEKGVLFSFCTSKESTR